MSIFIHLLMQDADDIDRLWFVTKEDHMLSDKAFGIASTGEDRADMPLALSEFFKGRDDLAVIFVRLILAPCLEAVEPDIFQIDLCAWRQAVGA